MEQVVKNRKLKEINQEQVFAEQSSEITPKPTVSTYLGIFFISASVLFFELSLTRIFAVMLWSHLAFMVVSTALFGFGLSGVFLALTGNKKSVNYRSYLSFFSLLVSFSILASYFVISNVPFQMWSGAFKVNTIENLYNYLNLGIWYVALVVPFFFAGIVIAKLLSIYKSDSSKLYGIDLVGAACGAFLILPLIPIFGGEGCIVLAAMFAAFTALCFSGRSFSGRGFSEKNNSSLVFLSVITVLGLAFILPNASEYFPVKLHQKKRRFTHASKHKHIYNTAWSSISRVDMAYHNNNTIDIWIDGGTNESAVLKWNGDVQSLKPQNWSSIGAVFKLKDDSSPKSLIIGPAGGKEVLFALSHKASHVDAVEMDPSIHKFMNMERYAKFSGYLYQNEKVNFVNDEGRSYLRRAPDETYDIIQSVNNYTPVALASGALNLSAAFLMTKEAFSDYLDKLKPNGVFSSS